MSNTTNNGNTHFNFAATYNPSYSQAPFSVDPSDTQQLDTQPPPPKRAKHRRKRHVPPGPAGLWYQSQLHRSGPRNTTTASQKHGNGNGNDNEEEEAAADVSSCPAWMCMQLSSNLLTPYLPPYYTAKKRYTVLRTLIPDEYTFLEEIHRPDHDLTISKKLIVLVHAIQCHSYCDWTVELRDECGSHIKAWCSPSFVKEEQDQPNFLRPGVVWCLQHLTIMPSFEGELWLLLNRQSFQSMWAAETVSDKAYLEWMGKREQIRIIDNVLDVNHDEESSSKVDDSSRQVSSQSEDDDMGGRVLRKPKTPIHQDSLKIGLPTIDLHPPSFLQARRKSSDVWDSNDMVIDNNNNNNNNNNRNKSSQSQLPTTAQPQNPPQMSIEFQSAPLHQNHDRLISERPMSQVTKKARDTSDPNQIMTSSAHTADSELSFEVFSCYNNDDTMASENLETVTAGMPTSVPRHHKGNNVITREQSDQSNTTNTTTTTTTRKCCKESPTTPIQHHNDSTRQMSKLWEMGMDDNMLDMLEEDDETTDVIENQAKESKMNSTEHPNQLLTEQPNELPKEQPPPLGAFLFDANNFGGMDMDVLFNED